MHIPFVRRTVAVCGVAIALFCTPLWTVSAAHAQNVPARAVLELPIPEIDLAHLAARAASYLLPGLDDVCQSSFERRGFRAAQSLVARAGLARPLRQGILPDYLARMRAIAPYAQVTSDFNDIRPGRRHNGYDIGLDYGTKVPAGWAGTVTKLTPWYDGQYGITVETNGIEVTYGHLAPDVKVGQRIEPGDTVGHIIWNHVDIKMFTCVGYVDWGLINPFDDPVLTELHCKATAKVALDDIKAVTCQPLRGNPRVTYQSAVVPH